MKDLHPRPLSAGFTSVPLDGAAHSGIHVDISHVAVTPIGMEVTANVELTATEGRSLVLKVECRDEGGVIGDTESAQRQGEFRTPRWRGSERAWSQDETKE